MTTLPVADAEAAFRAVSSRDPRFDGRLFVGVLSTGIYCRPSCPSRTPLPRNCAYFPTAAACVAAGFRACRRCRPDALPGSRDWDVDADLAGRALRMVGDGVVDEQGVAGLAGRLAVSPRHLHRVLVAQLGASPVQLAQTRRAQVARMLVEQTDWSMADVAFAAGFRSVRQFNDVMRAHHGGAPTSLRRSGRRPTVAPVSEAEAASSEAVVGEVRAAVALVGEVRAAVALVDEAAPSSRLTVQLRHRDPLDDIAWLAHVAARAVPGLEAVSGSRVRRVVPARGGPVLVDLDMGDRAVTAHLTLSSLDDLSRVVGRLRHWADLDADPARVDAALGGDPLLSALVERRPGLRVPGTVDPAELVLRAVLGQQVSLAAARTLTARLVTTLGEPTPWGLRQFPTPAALLDAGPEPLRAIGLTGGRARTVLGVAGLLVAGLPLGPGADRTVAREALAAVPGVGPWTVEYVALRALGDPDAFPAHDLVLRRSMGGVTASEAIRRAEAWRPWRGYAAQHLWTGWAEASTAQVTR
jgi:AraC family transcriptional regulator of adaptative response / DNA-3-methyladenine glycosylase II